MGLNFSMTGVFYNKKLAAQIGMTDAADDAGRARRRAGEGQGRRHPADPAVQRRRDRRPGLPAAEPDGAPTARRARSTTGSSRSRAPRSTRRRTSRRPQHLRAVDQGGLLRRGRQRGRLREDDEPVHRRPGPVHVQRRLGVGEPRQADARQRRLLPDAAGSGGRQAGGDVGAADLRDQREGQARRLRRVLPQLGGDQRQGARRSPSRSAARTRWVRPTRPCRPSRRAR